MCALVVCTTVYFISRLAVIVRQLFVAVICVGYNRLCEEVAVMRFPCLIIIAALAPLATALLTHTAGQAVVEAGSERAQSPYCMRTYRDNYRYRR